MDVRPVPHSPLNAINQICPPNFACFSALQRLCIASEVRPVRISNFSGILWPNLRRRWWVKIIAFVLQANVHVRKIEMTDCSMSIGGHAYPLRWHWHSSTVTYTSFSPSISQLRHHTWQRNVMSNNLSHGTPFWPGLEKTRFLKKIKVFLGF